MDAKITLSFDKEVIGKAKKFASDNGMSLSRVTEHLYNYIAVGHYKRIEDIPIADWVKKLSVGKPVYVKKRRTRKHLKNEFFSNHIH